MKNYVIGDIQGCYRGLKKLLKKVSFRPTKDKLWAVGDLIARGPDSLATMEYLYDLGPHFNTVLGNHDLHLIAAAHGVSKVKPQDKLQSLVNNKHFDHYIDFLSSKPLAMIVDKNTLISHAGLYPKWSIKKAVKLSGEIQTHLTGKNPTKFLQNMYGNTPDIWDNKLEGYARARFIVNAFTRMRYLHKDNSLNFTHKCHPDTAPTNVTPWYMVKNQKLTAEQTILFGHWASLLGDIPQSQPNPSTIVALDTGYVWGNELSLFCVENRKIYRYS